MHSVQPTELEIQTAPADLDRLLDFFAATAYEAEEVDDRTLRVVLPDAMAASIARREVQVYLRLLKRAHPALEAALVD